MDMQELAQMIAPSTSAQVSTVARRPTPAGVLALPGAMVQDVLRPALAPVDAALGALSGIHEDNPNLSRFLGRAEEAAYAAQGDPYYRQRSNLLEAQAGLFGARSRLAGARAGLTDAESGILRGMGTGGSAGTSASGAPLEITDDLLIRMSMVGMNEEANALRQIREAQRAYRQTSAERDAYGRMWSPEQIEKRRAELTKQFAPMQDLSRARAAIESTPVEGLSVPILVTALQQQLEPGLAVRQEDVRMLTEGALSGADLTMGDVMKWVDENALAPKMVPKLKEFALRMLGAREDLYAEMFENVLNEKDDLKLTDYGLRRSTPFWESGHEAIRRRDERLKSAGAESPVDSSVETPLPPGQGYAAPALDMSDEELNTLIKQIEHEMPGLDDQSLFREVRRRRASGGPTPQVHR